MEASRLGKLFVISGPSGVGKKAIIENLLKNEFLNLNLSISFTTRPKRFNEVDGVDYFFISKEEFEKKIGEGHMLEYAEFFNNYYGTSKEYVEKQLKEGKNVLLEIETLGFRQVLAKFPNLVSIFIAPTYLQVLEERLRKRGTENDADIAIRMKKARIEIEEGKEFKYFVINDVYEQTFEEILKIFLSEINK